MSGPPNAPRASQWLPAAGTDVASPFRIGPDGRVARSDPADHLRESVLLVLLTEPGERVNLPEFGCGLRRLAFAPVNEALVATVRFLVSHNLDRWLGDQLRLDDVVVTAEEGSLGTLTVEVSYTPAYGGGPRLVTVQV